MDDDRYASLKTENIVASGSIADALDIEYISSQLDGCELNKKKFPGAVLRLPNPKIVALLFTSGKVVLTGIKSKPDFYTGLNRILDLLKEVKGTQLTPPDVKITNMVCSFDTGEKINLNKMVLTFNLENIEYEPEQFPGLVYRIAEPKLVALLFSSGKLILTGGKNIDDVKSGVDIILQKIGELR